MPVIDAHVHVWAQDRTRYGFRPLDGLPAPGDVRELGEFIADSADEPIAGVLLIQPRVYGYDHSYIYDAAVPMDGRARVMPLIDGAGRDASALLGRYAQSPMTAGFRVIALGSDAVDWLGAPAAHQLWEAADERALPVGFLCDPTQLPLITQVAVAHPRLGIVVDHLARCRPEHMAEWAGPLCALANYPNVYVKISAIGTLSRDVFPHRDMWPLLQSVYAAGGAGKLMWGSDWPHTMASGRYTHSRAAVALALADAPAADLDAIFATTAAGLFGFDQNTTMVGATHVHT